MQHFDIFFLCGSDLLVVYDYCVFACGDLADFPASDIFLPRGTESASLQ